MVRLANAHQSQFTSLTAPSQPSRNDPSAVDYQRGTALQTAQGSEEGLSSDDVLKGFLLLGAIG